jgi:hypothetical protein
MKTRHINLNLSECPIIRPNTQAGRAATRVSMRELPIVLICLKTRGPRKNQRVEVVATISRRTVNYRKRQNVMITVIYDDLSRRAERSPNRD